MKNRLISADTLFEHLYGLVSLSLLPFPCPRRLDRGQKKIKSILRLHCILIYPQ